MRKEKVCGTVNNEKGQLDPLFIGMVENDIQRCKDYLASEKNKEDGMALHLELITRYPSYIKNFRESLYNYDEKHGFVMQEFFDLDSAIHNITVIMNKLIAFRNYGCVSPSDRRMGQQSTQINIKNSLTATQSQNISISFEDVKQQIEEMTGLSESETNEALSKIDEIKGILESKGNKKTKWQKIKPLLLWLADKSVDVGCAILPLILKIGEM